MTWESVARRKVLRGKQKKSAPFYEKNKKHKHTSFYPGFFWAKKIPRIFGQRHKLPGFFK